MIWQERLSLSDALFRASQNNRRRMRGRRPSASRVSAVARNDGADLGADLVDVTRYYFAPFPEERQLPDS